MQHGVTARRKRNERRKSEYFELKEQVKSNPGKINKMTVDLQREQKSFNHGGVSQNKRKMLFELDNVDKKLGNKVLINDFTTRILQKDIIAIVGPNGCGKSTILKILLGRMDIDSGSIKQGDFKVGYFDQHREMLNDDDTIMNTFCPNGGDQVLLNDGRYMHVFGYLKNFLFPKEYLTKKIGVLSGGEKNRVALALLFTKKIDVMILDEPTNDLDIPTINILEEYLVNFQGALIFVSHDRYFVDKIAKKLFVFTKNGKIMESYQPYSEYLEIEKEIEDLNKISKTAIEIESSPKQKIQVKTKTITKLTYKDQRRYEALPKEIDELELKISKLEKCVMDPLCYEEKGLLATSEELDNANKLYEKIVEEYLELEELVLSFNS
jgi:ATP-binding cassette subfamily F protein uup